MLGCVAECLNDGKGTVSHRTKKVKHELTTVPAIKCLSPAFCFVVSEASPAYRQSAISSAAALATCQVQKRPWRVARAVVKQAKLSEAIVGVRRHCRRGSVGPAHRSGHHPPVLRYRVRPEQPMSSAGRCGCAPAHRAEHHLPEPGVGRVLRRYLRGQGGPGVQPGLSGA